MQVDRISLELPSLYFHGVIGKKFKIIMHYCLVKICYYLCNSAVPDEMPHYAAFHLGLHCLPKYLFSFNIIHFNS